MSTSSLGLTGTASNSSSIFTGTSRFSTSFQNVITRTVALASLPIQQLQSEASGLQSQAGVLSNLGSGVTNLQSAIQQLQNAIATGSLATSSSDPTVAQSQIASGAHAGTYTLNVSSLGSYTNTLSQAGSTPVSDPSTQSISSSSAFTLTVNGNPITITPATSSLDGLVDAINASSNSGVQASIVNLGSSSSPDYRISLQSTQLGPDTIQLNDGNTDLLSEVSSGSRATYQVDGVQTPIESTSRTITLAPGLTVNLVGQSSSDSASTTIIVAPNTSGLQNSLTNFVNGFNSLINAVNQNVGQGGGALQGNSIVYELSHSLRSLGRYSGGSGSLTSLASIGVTFDQKGHLSFDSSAFSSATSNKLQSLTDFLGDTSTGGFLQFATHQLKGLNDPTTGIIPGAISSLQKQITNDSAVISADQLRVTKLQATLQAQLAASDALVASLEQSYTLVSGLFAAQLTNLKANS